MKPTQPQEEVHAILDYLNTSFSQATGGWKARGRKLRQMLTDHLVTLERLHERESQHRQHDSREQNQETHQAGAHRL